MCNRKTKKNGTDQWLSNSDLRTPLYSLKFITEKLKYYLCGLYLSILDIKTEKCLKYLLIHLK